MNRILVCLGLLLLPLSAEARLRRPALPLSVRMVVTVGELPEAIHPECVWTVSAGGTKLKLQVLSFSALSSSVSGLDVDAAVRMYPVQFQLTGPRDLVERVVKAPPGQQMIVMGFLRINATTRSLMLSNVDAGSAAPTPTPG